MAAVCRLMLEAPFSTRLCEQGHGSLAAEHKVHQEMGSKFVALRSALHQLRFMWTPTQDEKAEARLNTRLAALDRRRNHAVSGRNCFYGEMVSAAREEGFLQFETQQELMTMHVAEYNELPKEAKRFYDAEGRNRTEQNEQALSEEIQYTRSRQDLLQQRAKRQRTEEGTLNSATECRFSDDALERLAERDASGGFPKELVQATCAKIVSSPHDPEEEELRALDLFTADPEVYDDAHPWIKTVCQNRDSFKNVAFRIAADDDAGEAFRFLLAKKKPFWCMLLRMTRRPVAPIGGGRRGLLHTCRRLLETGLDVRALGLRERYGCAMRPQRREFAGPPAYALSGQPPRDVRHDTDLFWGTRSQDAHWNTNIKY